MLDNNLLCIRIALNTHKYDVINIWSVLSNVKLIRIIFLLLCRVLNRFFNSDMYKTSHQIDQMLLPIEQDRSSSHSNLDRKKIFYLYTKNLFTGSHEKI
jgi:hypothetical protein